MILGSTDSSIVSDIADTDPASPIPGEGWVVGLGEDRIPLCIFIWFFPETVKMALPTAFCIPLRIL